jgi:16S rRNA (uracil1498-N3)-methyltransferase
VNLLLVDATELAGDGTCTVADRRAQHLRAVLGVAPGSIVRAGIVGGAIGQAEVLADDGTAIALRITATTPPPPPLDVELVLAVPRPKVLSRVIETCAAFAVRRVDLANAWRVDKSYLRSPRLAPEALAHAARLGAEQGGTTHLPVLAIHDRLMALLDARFPAPGGRRLIAHPGAPPIEDAHARLPPGGPTIVAIGPEGGWIERELDTFAARGFLPCSLGAAVLRVEAAVAAVLGQLVVLDRLRG